VPSGSSTNDGGGEGALMSTAVWAQNMAAATASLADLTQAGQMLTSVFQQV